MVKPSEKVSTENKEQHKGEKINTVQIEDEAIQKLKVIIKINIKAIDNVEPKQPSSEIVIRVEYINTQLGESKKILCCEDGQTDVNFNVILNCIVTKPDAFDELAENPVLFTIIEGSSQGKKSPKETKKSSKEDRQQNLGRCNLDLLPLLLGECYIAECLLVEQDKRAAGQEVITWPNLPRLYVSAEVDEPITMSEDILNSNLLSFTVESIYNIIPKMTDNLVYTAMTRLPITSDKYKNITFEGGLFTEYHDVDRTKRWSSLMAVQGRGACSKYEVNNDYTTIKTDLDCELLKNLNKNTPHIEWNCLRRCWVTQDSCTIIFNDLAKYRLWPLELLFTTKTPENVKPKTKDHISQTMHCVAYLDLTALLYPGVTKARAACQVHTYCQEDLKLKCGVVNPLFEATPISPKDTSKGTKKNVDQKSTPKIQQNNLALEAVSVPLFNDQGEPMFIVVELELMKPILRSRDKEELYSAIEAAVPPRPDLPKRIMNAMLAEEHYQRCIQTLSEQITSTYREFMENAQGRYNHLPVDVIIQEFSLHLQSTGMYHMMKETLRNKISVLVREKCSDNLRPGASGKELQNFVSNVYIYFVEEMHIIINSLVESGESVADPVFQLSSDNQHYFAEEAKEEDNLNRAQKLYLERIAKDKKNPDVWIDYAVFYLSQDNVSKALECTKEALTLDIRHKLAMLMYGILLYQYGEFKDAELFFEALTCFYPRFVEAWMVFHLFYLQIEKMEGSDVTLQIGKKYFNKTREQLHYSCNTIDSLSWSSIPYERHTIFLTTAKVLMKLNMYVYAELALAQELGSHGSSISYLYYLAVNHYLSHRYEEAIPHLREAIRERARESCLWSLMGHCYHKLKNVEQAKECYKFVVDCEDRPKDIHLVNLRLGSYYLQDSDYNLAKSTYMDACIHSPSPLSWLGVGISFYMITKYTDAEKALSEANMLDNTCALTWGYLTLVNLQYQKQAEFEQCYRQTLRNNLQDEALLQQIKDLYTALNYPDPAPFATE